MQPVPSPGSHQQQTMRRRDSDRAARIRFRRAVTLLLMTLFLPGSAQLVAGNKQVGRIAMCVFFGCVAAAALVLLLSWIWPTFGIKLGTKSWFLGTLRLCLMILAVGWAGLFTDTWRLGEPLSLFRNQRLAIVGINGLLCFSVVGTLLVGAHLIGTGRDFLAAVFGGDTVHDPSHGRYNVLLLGGDAGAGRWGLRPDSLTVASIDADTGRTLLVGLPRNMTNFRFAKGSVMDEQFPDGFDCEGCYLNAVSTWALDNKELFPAAETPGVDATIQAVEGITGLDVDYWALVDLNGFKRLIDAVGGVTLNVRSRIPVGLPSDSFYAHIEPGRKLLNGFETLWFARARYDSDDYSRMARQKCVMNALLQQVDAQTLIRNFDKIAAAGKAMFKTNIPPDQISRFADLALKAKSQQISTLSLVPPLINPGDPKLKLMRAKVGQAIDKAEGNAGKPAHGGPKRPKGEVRGGSIGSPQTGYAANEAQDLSSAC